MAGVRGLPNSGASAQKDFILGKAIHTAKTNPAVNGRETKVR